MSEGLQIQYKIGEANALGSLDSIYAPVYLHEMGSQSLIIAENFIRQLLRLHGAKFQPLPYWIFFPLHRLEDNTA